MPVMAGSRMANLKRSLEVYVNTQLGASYSIDFEGAPFNDDGLSEWLQGRLLGPIRGAFYGQGGGGGREGGGGGGGGGREGVWRRYADDGRMAGDVVSTEGDRQPGEALVHQVMAAGRRIHAAPTLGEIRARAAGELARLPEPLRQLQVKPPYTVDVAEALKALAAETDKRLARSGG